MTNTKLWYGHDFSQCCNKHNIEVVVLGSEDVARCLCESSKLMMFHIAVIHKNQLRVAIDKAARPNKIDNNDGSGANRTLQPLVRFGELLLSVLEPEDESSVEGLGVGPLEEGGLETDGESCGAGPGASTLASGACSQCGPL